MDLTHVPNRDVPPDRSAAALAIAALHGPRSMNPAGRSHSRRSPLAGLSRRRLLSGSGVALAAGAVQACDAWSVVGQADDRYPGGSPFAIEALRARDYRAGDIRLHRVLGRHLTYTSYAMTYRSDDLLLTGVATIPNAAGPHPVVVLNHGFTLPVQFHSGDGTRAMAAELSPRGFITLASDYRGLGGSEDDTRTNLGARLDFAIDVLNLVASIPSLPGAQHERVGMWGHSLGCDLALRAAEVDARVQPVGMWAPLSAWAEDLVDYYRLPTLASSQDLRHALSPGNFLNYLVGPVTIHQGEADLAVKPHWAMRLHAALGEAGVVSELTIHPGVGHYLTLNARRVVTATADFFERELLEPRE